ncbi:MAG TPA: ATP-binding protein [Gaiellaceae bacterium]|jgi:signal transduction histidine kinase
MRRRFIGVRWWLGIAFAVVAATSTAIVVAQFSNRSEAAFRRHGQAVALKDARLATKKSQSALGSEFHTYATAGTAPTQLERDAVTAALAGHEFSRGTADGGVYVAGVPYRGGALVAVAHLPDLAEAIDTVNGEALRAGVIAGVIGVIVGLLLAQLIALRLRRLTLAAEGIASGDFETPLHYRVRDEFGVLALSFDRMRRQLRRSFRRLEAERDRLQLLLESLHEGVLTIDQDLVVHYTNAEARRLLGGRLAEGDPLPEPWPGFGLREFAQTLFEERSTPVHVHVTPDENRAFGVVGIPSQPDTDWALLVIDDLTEQERRELAEREFVSNAAHELRTPLTTIIGAVDVLQAGAKDDPVERDRFLAHIERESGRLARLARAMLTLARAHAGTEAPRVEAVAVAALLRDVASELRPHDGVSIDVEAPEDLTVESNPDLLEQALRNIGENAAKHTARGSVVLRAYRRGTSVTIEVEDSGPGISPDVQRHVFDRFYRGERDADGFGLGLAIVRESVRTLGGRIELDSSPGEGTVFRIVLAGARVRERMTA